MTLPLFPTGAERIPTADEFERDYAARADVSVEELRRYRTPRPCACGDPACVGWQMLSHEAAAEYDAQVGGYD